MYLAYITCKDSEEAEKIAEHLLNKKLIACANIFDSKSIYHWKGELCNQNEKVLILKTDKKFQDIVGEVKAIHSYELPCILKINVEATQEFGLWVANSIKEGKTSE